MARETGKQRKARIDLAYYRQPTAASRWRLGLGLLAVGLAIGWVGLSPRWRPARGVQLFQWKGLSNPGPLASPHALWEDRCEACHEPFRAVAGAGQAGTGSDANCQSCHRGPEHSPKQGANVSSCADCHRDHQGRNASLVSDDDRFCTSCHADLVANGIGGGTKPVVANHVVGFDASDSSHPEFAPVRPGEKRAAGIAFDHARHLTAGMAEGEGGLPVFRYAQLPEGDRARYGWKPGTPLEAPVAMTCAMCHQLDNADLASRLGLNDPPQADTITPRGEGGAAMLPIRYRNHCQACHPLGYEPRDPSLVATHGRPAADVLKEIARVYEAQVIAEEPALLERRIPPRPLPADSTPPEVNEARERVRGRTHSAARILFGAGSAGGDRGGCLLCHRWEEAPKPLAEPEGLASVESARFVASAIPSVWLTGASFDHTAHRGMDCASCHAAGQSRSSEDVLLPDRKSCLPCHDSSMPPGSAGSAGASCTTCHRYHGGEWPWHGRGSEREGAAVSRRISEFLDPAVAPSRGER